MPYGTDVTSLIATFTTTGKSVSVGGISQESATTANDFSSWAEYTVTAADGTTAIYTVIVTVASSSDKALTAYYLAGRTATIDESAKTIAVDLPYGAKVTALSAVFTTTGQSVKVGATVQVSGLTPNDFTSAISYIVTAADGTTATYAVTATTAKSAIPRTGQTASYTTGDDGALQKGVAWPGQRFTGNGDGTVTDNLTGLVWLQNANCFGKATWADALSRANSLQSGSCGLTDGSVAGEWRLPNRNELRSLVNLSQTDTSAWLNHSAQGFGNVQSDYYWSSTTYTHYAVTAWMARMQNGLDDVGDKTDVSNGHYVWPLRTGKAGMVNLPRTGQATSYDSSGIDDGGLREGASWPSPRFTDNGNGTMKDNLTGLIWLQNANCFGSQTWAAAVNDANNLQSGSCGLTDGSVAGDWRLPNSNELASLAHAGQDETYVWLAAQGFVMPVGNWWTSTTYAVNTSGAWVIGMQYGNLLNYAKTESSGIYVWAVRGGQ